MVATSYVDSGVFLLARLLNALEPLSGGEGLTRHRQAPCVGLFKAWVPQSRGDGSRRLINPGRVSISRH
jgi:hypothetical protein